MSFSLNETEALAKRAARGGGYPWGLAEEAGMAVRFLCLHGLDGVADLVRLLDSGYAGSLADRRPITSDVEWRGQKTLCPLMTGAHVSDRGGLGDSGAVRIRDVASPLLILPFTANLARQRGLVLSVTFGGVYAATNGMHLECPDGAFDYAHDLTIEVVNDLTNPRQRRSRVTPDTIDLEVLNRYAHRTYAPATEESRRLGAGTALSDND